MNMKQLLWPTLGAALAITALLVARQATSVPDSPDVAAKSSASSGAAESAPASGDRVRAEGQVTLYPGAEVLISAQAAGQIERLAVDEKDNVSTGARIATLESSEARAATEQARAIAAEAKATVEFWSKERARYEQLLADGVATPQEVDRVVHEHDAASARLDAAAASTRRLQAMLDKTVVTTPIEGTVLQRFVEEGEWVEIGAPVVRIADLSRVRIEAEVDEYDVARIAPGSQVTVRLEAFPGQSWRAQVEEIPDEIDARSLRPRDPGRPSDTGVLRVKVALREAAPLVLGQRVDLTIEVD